MTGAREVSERHFLELLKEGDRPLVPLVGDKLSVGRLETNDLPIANDHRASRIHALFERIGPGWTVRDLSSRNGTWVNDARISGERVLKDGDRVTVGDTVLRYRVVEPSKATSTIASGTPPPELTRREREVLAALSRQIATGQPFAEPTPVREIAAELFVSEAAVRQHVMNLYNKFGLYDADRRLIRLVQEAMQRRAITSSDFRDP